MMRQSEFKMRCDPELRRYTRQHIYGEGMMDVFKSFGSKLFGKTMKKAAKKEVEKAVTSAATKTGEHVGKKAGDKIVQMLTKSNKTPNGGIAPPQNPPASWYPQNPPAKKRKMTQQEINQRVNSILSGGKII